MGEDLHKRLRTLRRARHDDQDYVVELLDRELSSRAPPQRQEPCLAWQAVTMPSREGLLAEIARGESRLVDLKAEVETAAARLAGLCGQLAALPVVHVPIQPKLIADVANALATNAAKVDLFRSLFRGRDDVFARRWENEKKGKSGYSPACENEWEWGLCEKKKGPGAGKRTTCGECPNQAFVPVSNDGIARHLRGDQVMGVYPLLADETCWFLAADFDKKNWREDVTAFTATCRQYGVPLAIERSRSGNGAHAWFFFASPVSAVAARKLTLPHHRDHGSAPPTRWSPTTGCSQPGHHAQEGSAT